MTRLADNGAVAARASEGGVGSAARAAWTLRRDRDRIFDSPGLFGEPAWDLLLDLYVARGDGRTVSLDEASAASGVAASTALRCILLLIGQGLVERADNSAAGAGLVRLSDLGQARLEQLFAD